MFRKIILPLLAIAGVALGILAALKSARTMVPAPMVSTPPAPPYRAFVAGAGLVEANTENIAIGTQLAGVVSQIYVQIGSTVQKGDPLFTIDDRAQKAIVAVKKAAVQYAQAQFDDMKRERNIGEGLTNQRVLSVEERDTRRFAEAKAEAQLEQARADLGSASTDLERLTVRAPVDGEVLQLKVHLGEYAPAGTVSPPLLLLGGTQPLNVRVDIDENDATRVLPGAAAVGFLRGNKQVNTPLKFVRFEPYVIPKVSLTGSSNERVDTRVLQAIYSFDRGSLPIYVGQQMDVYIDASTLPPASAASSNTAGS